MAIKIKIIPIISQTFDSNVYLILDKFIALIDTGAGASSEIKDKVETLLENKEVDLIINTHAHADHVGGNSLFDDAKVLIHEKEIKEMESGNLYGTYAFIDKRIPVNPVNVNKALKEGNEINLGKLNLEVINSPGHTPGCICLYEKNEKILFSGDTLFPYGNFGRVDLEGGSMTQLINSLKKLQNYDFDKIFPGHMEVVEKGKEHLEESLKNALTMVE